MKVNTNAWDAILAASPVVQLTLLILVGLSVLCWAVAYTKWRAFKKTDHQNNLFLTRFWNATSFDSLFSSIDEFKESSLANLFRASFVEMQRIAASQQSAAMSLGHVESIERSIRKAMDTELLRLEGRLQLLATTGSTGPFIGLFGTVWGIMGSFHKIGATGNASLAVVAPGISEALVATAIGLAAAIPAVMLYNNFVSRIRRMETEMNSFSGDLINIIKRNFVKGP